MLKQLAGSLSKDY